MDLWHLEIGENDAKTLRAELVECLLAIDGYRDVVSFVAQNGAQPFSNGTVVVRDQNFCVLGFRLWNGYYLRA